MTSITAAWTDSTPSIKTSIQAMTLQEDYSSRPMRVCAYIFQDAEPSAPEGTLTFSIGDPASITTTATITTIITKDVDVYTLSGWISIADTFTPYVGTSDFTAVTSGSTINELTEFVFCVELGTYYSELFESVALLTLTATYKPDSTNDFNEFSNTAPLSVSLKSKYQH